MNNVLRIHSYLAYVAGSPTALSLRVRQVATGSDVEVIPAGTDPIETPAFSPDGNYLFYRMRRRDAQTYSALYQIPSLGGAPQERVFDVDSRVTFSPDGKRLAFWRNVTDANETRLVVFDLEAAHETVLAAVPNGEFPIGPAAWSPDGKTIVGALFAPEHDLSTTIALFDPTTGKRRDLERLPWFQPRDFAWLPDGSGLVLAATTFKSSLVAQVQLVAYPGKGVQRVTNDFNNYASVGASGGTEPAIAALRQSRLSNLWVLDVDGGETRAITRVANPESSPSNLAVLDSTTLVYAAARDGGYHVWSVPVAGGEPRMLTSGTSTSINVVTGGGRLLFDRLDAGGVHVWSMNADGSNAKPWTTGSGEQHQGIAPDGSAYAFSRYNEPRTTHVVSSADQREILRVDRTGILGFSRDSGSYGILRLAPDARGLLRPVILRVRIRDGAVVDSVAMPGNATGPQWAPDAGGVLYRSTEDPAGNLFRLAFGAATPVPVTHLTAGRITDFLVSPDASRIALTVRDGGAENVWVTAIDGTGARPVTRFTGEEVFEMKWVTGRRTLAISAGTLSTDVVLIRDFR